MSSNRFTDQSVIKNLLLNIYKFLNSICYAIHIIMTKTSHVYVLHRGTNVHRRYRRALKEKSVSMKQNICTKCDKNFIICRLYIQYGYCWKLFREDKLVWKFVHKNLPQQTAVSGWEGPLNSPCPILFEAATRKTYSTPSERFCTWKVWRVWFSEGIIPSGKAEVHEFEVDSFIWSI